MEWIGHLAFTLRKRGYFRDLKACLDTLAQASFCVTIRDARCVPAEGFTTEILGFPGWRLNIFRHLGLILVQVRAMPRRDIPDLAATKEIRRGVILWQGRNVHTLIGYLQSQQYGRIVAKGRGA